jgi:hypothetical protein
MTKRVRNNVNDEVILNKNGNPISDEELEIISGNWGTEKTETIKRLRWFTETSEEGIPIIRTTFGDIPFIPLLIVPNALGSYDDIMIQSTPDGIPFFYPGTTRLQPYLYGKSLKMYADMAGISVEQLQQDMGHYQQAMGSDIFINHETSEERRIMKVHEDWNDCNKIYLTPDQKRAAKEFEDAIKEAEAQAKELARRAERDEILQRRARIMEALARHQDAIDSCAANQVGSPRNENSAGPRKRMKSVKKCSGIQCGMMGGRRRTKRKRRKSKSRRR